MLPSNDARDPQEGNALYERWNLVVRHWWLILLIMIIAGFVGWGASYIKSEDTESNTADNSLSTGIWRYRRRSYSI